MNSSSESASQTVSPSCEGLEDNFWSSLVCPCLNHIKYTTFIATESSLGDPVYDDHVCKNYDLLTAENVCKWYKVSVLEVH